MLSSALIPLEGRWIRLLPLSEDLIEPLVTALDHPEVWRWTPPGVLETAAIREHMHEFLADNQDGRLLTWVVIEVEDGTEGRVVGTTGWSALRPQDRSVEGGRTMYAPAVWGRGVNLEAKLLLLSHGFETVGLQRIEFKTDADNARSRAALEALGATFEGIHRKHMNTAYGVRDSAWYSVIDDEWPMVRAGIERRLREQRSRAR